jgi:preprotein translocase subunit Sec61beta
VTAPRSNDHDHDHEETAGLRSTRGRRSEDYAKKNIEIHPTALSIVAAFFTILLSVAGYFFKGWADNITYEIRQFRLAAEKQLTENATHNEWKNGMSKWRDDVDGQLKDLDNRMNTLPWSVQKRMRKTSLTAEQKQQPQIYGGSR